MGWLDKYEDQQRVCPVCKAEFTWTREQQYARESNNRSRGEDNQISQAPTCSHKCANQLMHAIKRKESALTWRKTCRRCGYRLDPIRFPAHRSGLCMDCAAREGQPVPEKEPRLSVEQIMNRIAEIKQRADNMDDHGAHEAADSLYIDVLRAIASSNYEEEPYALAAAALGVEEISFSRFYS